MDESSPSPEESSSTSQLDSAPCGNHPPPSPDSSPEEDHSVADHAAKRRKKCPESFDKVQESHLPNRTHSFTFDNKFSASPPDSTPKFGSFKIPPADVESEKEQEVAGRGWWGGGIWIGRIGRWTRRRCCKINDWAASCAWNFFQLSI